MRLLFLSLIYIVCAACVSRYDPVEQVKPLSGECRDYAGFSRALAVQRNNGFTKGATLSIAGYSVGSERDREYLYRQYKTVFDLIFTDYQIKPATAGVLGKLICEQRQKKQWVPLVEADYEPVTGFIRFCQSDNFSLVDLQNCMQEKITQYHQQVINLPPAVRYN